MKKSTLVVIYLVAVLVFSVGCSKSNTSNNISSNSSPASSSAKNSEEPSETFEVKTSDAKSKSNLQAFLDIMIETVKPSKFRSQHDFARFTVEFGKLYKNDIKNPYNKSTEVYMINRSSAELEDKDIKFNDGYAASIIYIETIIRSVKDLDKSTVTYGCTESNKGMVMAFVFDDGFYLYEVDEKGNKVNETVHELY